MTASERRTDVVPSGASSRALLLERTVLDEQMRRSRKDDPRPWGVLPWLGPLFTVPALIVGGYLVHAHALPGPGAGRTAGIVAMDIGGELVLLAALLGRIMVHATFNALALVVAVVSALR